MSVLYMFLDTDGNPAIRSTAPSTQFISLDTDTTPYFVTTPPGEFGLETDVDSEPALADITPTVGTSSGAYGWAGLAGAGVSFHSGTADGGAYGWAAGGLAGNRMSMGSVDAAYDWAGTATGETPIGPPTTTEYMVVRKPTDTIRLRKPDDTIEIRVNL
jgi:hypothetical protein